MMATLNKKGSGGNIKGGVNKDNGDNIRNFVKVKALYYLWLLLVSYEGVEDLPYRHSIASASDIAK